MQKIYLLKQIETPRLIIRPVQLGDEIQLNKAVNNSLETLQKWMPWANDPSLETTRNHIQKGVFSRVSKIFNGFPMVVILKSEQKIISGCGYNERSNPSEGLLEIGYWCDIDYRGKGYVTEFTNALTQYALKELGAKIIVIRVNIDNLKSIAIPQRLNFDKQGTKPSVAMDNAIDYYFTCTELKKLPLLIISWDYEENDNIDFYIIKWAKETLKITDDKAFANSRIILKTPWSSLMLIDRGSELVYLKHTPELIALEAKIIKILHDQFKVSVPKIIAHNDELHCFIMKSAGRSLREILKQRFDEALVCEAANQFILLQKSVENHVNLFIELGVPDWRLDKLTHFFEEILSNKDLFIEDGLSEFEYTKTTGLLSVISDLCNNLSQYGIKQSLVQSDFHDNNILIDDSSNKITNIDLGEIVISHPFFSLVGFLKQLKKHHNITEKDQRHHRIKEVCLNNYITPENKEAIFKAFDSAQILWAIYDILCQYRLFQACDKEKLMSRQRGKISNSLREFMLICPT